MPAGSDPLLEAISSDEAALLAAVPEPDMPVASCPGWSIHDLAGHVGSAQRWAAHVVQGGIQPQARVLAEPPADVDELTAWCHTSTDDLLSLLEATDPDAPIWTPTSGVTGSRWWRRKIAVETGIHRWDAQVARSDGSATPLAPLVATAAIEEYLTDFLPGLLRLHVANTALDGVLQLISTDTETSWQVTLNTSINVTTTVTASSSDLALWIWNRLPDPLSVLAVSGAPQVVSAWSELRI